MVLSEQFAYPSDSRGNKAKDEFQSATLVEIQRKKGRSCEVPRNDKPSQAEQLGATLS